jgi:hypothetical protein
VIHETPSDIFKSVGFQVLTAVVMKSTIFWNIILRSLLKVNRHFRGNCRLYLQGPRISQARNHRKSGWHSKAEQKWFLAWLIL